MPLAERIWPEIAALVPHTPVVVPVAAMEQHRRQLPLATGSMRLGGLVRRVESQVRRTALFAPLPSCSDRSATPVRGKHR